MSSGSVSKKCPKCNKVDATTFSTCRSCGTKYDYKPPEKTREFNFIPIILVAAIAVIAASAIAFTQVNNLYKRPEQLIGKTLVYKGNSLFVSTDKANLLSLPPDEFKLLSHYTVDTGIQDKSDTAALNTLAGISTEMGLREKYQNDSRFTTIFKMPNEPPFSVKVIGASAPSDKYSLVQVEMQNGPRPKSVWWTDSSHLDLSIKDR